MKRYAIAILVGSTFGAQMVMGAGPLNIGAAATLIKALNRSIVQPIKLYQSTDAANFPAANNVFTTQTLARLGAGGIPASELSAVRNEICASSKVQAANGGQPFAATPGPIGVYLNEEQILAVYDNALMGERLDSVLKKLKNADIVTKTREAGAYALQMVNALDAIHAGDVTWNNASLHDFYVRPDGTLTAINFSAAKNSLGGVDTVDKKNERMSLIANAIRPMYEILFPAAGQDNAGNAYNQFIALPGIGAGWRGLDLIQLTFQTIAALAPAPAYRPGVENALPVRAGVLRANHSPAAGAGPTIAANMGGATGFVLEAAVVPFVPSAPGVPATTNLVDMCANWTGNE